MTSKDQIKNELERYLNQGEILEDDSIVVLEEKTIEKESFYVFFYMNKKFLETNNFSDMLVGNAPIIVDKVTGERYVTGTAYPIEHYIKEYEQRDE